MMSVIMDGCEERGKSTLAQLKARGHSAVVPAHGSATEWWGERHRQIVDRVGQGNVDLIFVGDSITHGWERTGASLWETYYVPRRAVNMGFDGDNTQHALWRLE